MQEIRLKDKAVFDGFFNRYPASLSMYSFASIFVWKKFFDIFWGIIDDCLCVFYKNELGSFMPLMPMGDPSPKTIFSTFEIMDKLGGNKLSWRIENISEKKIAFYEGLGYKIRPKDNEYLYSVSDMVKLSGGGFKSKRSSFNFFVKNYDYSFEKLDSSFARGCLVAYKDWARGRAFKYRDSTYQACLEDSLAAQEAAFKNFVSLGFRGWVVKIKGKIRAYSLGLALDKDIFYIMFETADLDIKGLSQFIFRSFCANLTDFKFINAGDDSGFINLARVKGSYKPRQILKSFIAERNS